MKSQFNDLLARLGARNTNGEFSELKEKYSEIHRVHHTLCWVKEALRELDDVAHSAQYPDAIRLALYYQKTVYHPGADDNEKKSAILAADTCKRLALPENLTRRIERLVLASKPTMIPLTDDEMIAGDIARAILGKEPKTFMKYEKDLLEEHLLYGLSEKDFRENRITLFNTLMSEEGRESIYLSRPFQQKYEEQARANIEVSIRALEKAA